MTSLHRSEKRLDIFTWHIHGSYLYYLSRGDYNIYIPVNKERSIGYGGRGDTFPFGDNVIEIAAGEVRNRSFDCILFQSEKNYLTDQYELFSVEQQEYIPKVYLEHDPPRKHPTDTRHVLQDPYILLVQVTQFNKLMWKSSSPAKVIEHGVTAPPYHYTGVLNKGAVVINNLPARGRRLGADIFLTAQKHVPLDLIGISSEEYGGVGEIPLSQLPGFLSCYRFLFNPIRYTSLGLAVCEAMMLGMPVVGLATTEMATVIKDGVSGFTDTDPEKLIGKMKILLEDKDLAAAMGKEARRTAETRFDISRFTAEWADIFNQVIKRKPIDEKELIR